MASFVNFYVKQLLKFLHLNCVSHSSTSGEAREMHGACVKLELGKCKIAHSFVKFTVKEINIGMMKQQLISWKFKRSKRFNLNKRLLKAICLF